MKNKMLFLDCALENRAEDVFQRSVLYLSQKELGSRRDVLCVPINSLFVENKRVCTEGLHEPLNSAIAQQFRDRALFGNFLPEIKKLILVLCCVIEVWIVDKRRKIVFLTS